MDALSMDGASFFFNKDEIRITCFNLLFCLFLNQDTKGNSSSKIERKYYLEYNVTPTIMSQI